jgi:hypothetical protein
MRPVVSAIAHQPKAPNRPHWWVLIFLVAAPIAGLVPAFAWAVTSAGLARATAGTAVLALLAVGVYFGGTRK